MTKSMQNFRNYYEILEIETQATPEDIKRAFRRLARRYHPDMNPGDKVAEDKFKDINEAYEVLSDGGRRSQYDQFTRFVQTGTKRKPGRGAGNGQDPNAYTDFNRFVEDLLTQERNTSSARMDANTPEAYRQRRTKTERPAGKARPERPPSGPRPQTRRPEPRPEPRQRPRDVEANLSIPLEKAFTGGRERIRLDDGRSLEVEMPAGMIDGQKIRLRNQGLNGGNLYLKITVDPHDRFSLRDRDVLCTVPVTPSEAILGGLVEVPTLDGLVKMNVPKGVRSGQKLRLANKGFPLEDSDKRGDQIVEIQILIPPSVSPEEEALYAQIREIETFKPRHDFVSS
jgi:curved DNA-binding protein